MTEALSERLTHTTRGRVIIVSGLLALAVMVGLGVFVATKSTSRPSADRRSTRLVGVISQTIASKGIDAGVAQYRSLRERGFPGLPESASDTNNLGYQFLRKGENQAAIQVFQLNVETHPKSSNAYDSLGEAYAAAGNKDLAIENYRKALAFDPENTNSKAALFKAHRASRNAILSSVVGSYHRRRHWIAFWVPGPGFAQRLQPASPGRKSIRRIHDMHGRSRGMAGFYEIPAVQCSGRYPHVLPGGDILGHGQTPTRRNQ
jgi:hypothetical protein